MASYGDAKPKFSFLQISTQVAVATWLLLEVYSVLMSQYLCMYIDWCTGRLSLIELYDNRDLNLVPNKIMKKNMRRIPYSEVVFIKFRHFYICYKEIMKNVGSTVVNI